MKKNLKVARKWKMLLSLLILILNLFWFHLIIYLNFFPVFSNWFLYINKLEIKPSEIFESSFEKFRKKVRMEKIKMQELKHLAVHYIGTSARLNFLISRSFYFLERNLQFTVVSSLPWFKKKILVILIDICKEIHLKNSEKVEFLKSKFMNETKPITRSLKTSLLDYQKFFFQNLFDDKYLEEFFDSVKNYNFYIYKALQPLRMNNYFARKCNFDSYRKNLLDYFSGIILNSLLSTQIEYFILFTIDTFIYTIRLNEIGDLMAQILETYY